MIGKIFLFLTGKIKRPTREDGEPLDNTNRNFKGQQANEVIACFCRKHWMIIVPQIIGIIFTTALIVLWFVIISNPDVRRGTSPLVLQFVNLVAIIFYTWHFQYFFLKIFNYYLRTFIITNTRIVDLNKTLYFKHNLDSTDLHEIKDLTVSKSGILKTLFDYGEITVIRGTELVMKTHFYVPNPNYHFRKIHQAKREYILWRTREKGRAKGFVKQSDTGNDFEQNPARDRGISDVQVSP